MRCLKCGAEKRPNDRTIWFEVSGFAQHRSEGGTNALALRRTTGRIMCHVCMLETKTKVIPGQEKLL